MGERTQLLIAINIFENMDSFNKGDKPYDTIYQAFHYSWGWGRVMPMHFLDIVMSFAKGVVTTNSGYSNNTIAQATQLLTPAVQFIGYQDDANFGELFQKNNIAMNERQRLIFNPDKFSNNEQGYQTAILNVVFECECGDFRLINGETHFFRGICQATGNKKAGLAISLQEWHNSFSNFIDNDWYVGYKSFMKHYEIALDTPARLSELNKAIRPTLK
ncbi:hypothetical protein WOSG25_070160 [Weissella oryzae SG25]|uniref:Uncharacterized protein n=1 Tax=Weissella oryzae (strain DSM 25784 / JCM 18191 / LMG 30913 / SG25) TaxID=1329250 RepID=A0A069CU57_WEIOS|nr:hypothetical protein [Weissella oryzae]GAK31039.1 hypothetical protein WOSG25_070160 [Weissella oryzae SG25]